MPQMSNLSWLILMSVFWTSWLMFSVFLWFSGRVSTMLFMGSFSITDYYVWGELEGPHQVMLAKMNFINDK